MNTNKDMAEGNHEREGEWSFGQSVFICGLGLVLNFGLERMKAQKPQSKRKPLKAVSVNGIVI
jgi:hypothetical protein